MNCRPENDIIKSKANKYMYEHFSNESFPFSDPEEVILIMSSFANQYHLELVETYKQETVKSLKSSLMSRFKTMHHASEERYAEEAAKFFAWIVDSWKREEEDNSTTAENNCSKCGTYLAFGADICTICDLLKI